MHLQKSMTFTDDLIVDNFAGGGGASLGIEMAMGRPVDIAINHDERAIQMHEYNHPHTEHYHASVWDVDPRAAVNGRKVKLAWFSPDCKHFSKAKGGKPVSKNIRGLAWVALRWAATVRPDVIMLENVEEFATWGPLSGDKPCPKRKGETFQAFTKALNRQGYTVEYRVLRACDYGAPTTRKRLFMIARRDGEPIIWPTPSHGPNLTPYKTAAEIIDWSIPCPSIFERRRPLAENTLRRIAKGLEKFVFNNPEPFIVSYYGPKKPGEFREQNLSSPLPTQTTENRFALVTPYITRIGHTGFGGDGMQYQVTQPLTTITSKAEHCLLMPVLDRQFGRSEGASVDSPVGSITAGGSGKTALVAAFVAKHFGGQIGASANKPYPTITSRGTQNQLVTADLVPTSKSNHISDVRAFLIKYYSTNVGLNLNEPLHTVPTKDRFGLVTVEGQDYQIVDIGMRMLSPRELYRAQGFPDWYCWGNLTKTEAVAKCGNSVSPVVARALVESNLVQKSKGRKRA